MPSNHQPRRKGARNRNGKTADAAAQIVRRPIIAALSLPSSFSLYTFSKSFRCSNFQLQRKKREKPKNAGPRCGCARLHNPVSRIPFVIPSVSFLFEAAKAKPDSKLTCLMASRGYRLVGAGAKISVEAIDGQKLG